MVFGIVERHGGQIAVSSGQGQGTTFSLRLPFDVEGPVAASAAVVPTSVLPVRVLVVDDEPRLARMLAAMLSRDNHDVETTLSGEQAIAHLEAGGYDVVVSDLSMGTGINGWQLAEEIARRWPDTRFVLASGWGAGIGDQEARQRSVDGVLAKPYRLDQVRTVLGRLTT
jgi:CheY-like chemotaxis protein